MRSGQFKIMMYEEIITLSCVEFDLEDMKKKNIFLPCVYIFQHYTKSYVGRWELSTSIDYYIISVLQLSVQ